MSEEEMRNVLEQIEKILANQDAPVTVTFGEASLEPLPGDVQPEAAAWVWRCVDSSRWTTNLPESAPVIAPQLKYIFLTCLVAGSVVGQPEATELQTGTREFGVWGGFSPGSTRSIGTAEDRKFGLAAFRMGVVFATTENVAFSYTADLIGLAAVFQPPVYRVMLTPDVNQEIRNEGTITGWGFAPVGFRVTFNRLNRRQPFFETTGGMLRTRIPVPVNVPEATRWNFTFDFGVGLQLMTESGRAVRFGYKFHHLSNANRTRVNPGLDSHVIFAGFSLFR